MFLDIFQGHRGHKSKDSEIHTACNWPCNWQVPRTTSHFLPGLPIIHDKNLSLPLSEDEDGGEQELITNDGRSKFTYLTWVLLHYFRTPEVQLEIVL